MAYGDSYAGYAQSMADLIRQSGEAQARAVANKGAVWGNAIANIGPQVLGTMADLTKQRQVAQDRADVQADRTQTRALQQAQIGNLAADNARATDAETRARQAADFDKALKTVGFVGQVMGDVTDQTGYEQALGALQGAHIDTTSFPKVYTPDFVKHAVTSAMTIAQQIEAKKPQLQPVAAGASVIDAKNPSAGPVYTAPPDPNVAADNARADAALAQQGSQFAVTSAETARANRAREAQAAAALKDKNAPIDISADIATTASGRKVLDLSLYQGEARNRARAAAAAAGVTAVSKEDADTLKLIDNARFSQNDILAQINAILPKDPQGRVLGAPGRKLSAVFQTDAARAAFATWRSAAIQTLKATAGAKGLRINQAEIAQAVENDIPTLNDTLDVAKTKNANINKMLDNAERPITDRDRSNGAPKADPLGLFK